MLKLKNVGLFLLYVTLNIPYVAYAVEDVSIGDILVNQQTTNIRGTVYDADGPIIGASIAVRGTNRGTITDVNGEFSLDVVSGTELVVSYLGYESRTVTAENGMRVVLQEDVTRLDDVVVVGYGVQKRVNLTGSVASIDAKALDGRPLTSVSASLAGLLPGVSIAQTSGQPGSDGGTIRIRGIGTLNTSSPMIIVDGVEAPMDNIDPNDIESVTVLKDAASAAIYGSKASNGVILITTKRGQRGSSITYAGNVGWQSPTALPKYMGSAEYAELYNRGLYNDNPNQTPQWTAEQIQKFRDGSDPYNYPDTDWQNLFYQGSGMQTSHNVNVSGGSDNVTYMTSVGYQFQDGVIKNFDKNQYNVRSNVDIKATSRLDVGINISFSRIDTNEPTNSYTSGGEAEQIFRQINLISPWVPYKRENGDYGFVADGNPIAWIDLDQLVKRKRSDFLGIGSLQYKFMEGLSLRGVLSYKTTALDQNAFIKDLVYNPAETAITPSARKYHGPNRMTQTDETTETVVSDIYMNYNKTFNTDHNLALMAGFHSEYYLLKQTTAYRQNFPSNSLGNINAGATDGQRAGGYTRDLAMLSWFGRATYDYKGIYLLEANFRYDGSSRFAEGNRWGLFPSFSAGWRISEEAFMESAKETLDNLKVRASWGKLGNQAALNDYYPTIPTFSLGNSYTYPFGGSMSSGGAVVSAKNQNLKWETSRTWGVGVDATLFSKLNLTVDYYNRLTSDILMTVPTPDTYALSNYWDNVGEVLNKGVEFSFSYNTRVDKVNLIFGGNIAYNENEIKKLAGQDEIISGRSIQRIGEALGSVYGYRTDGLFQSQEEIDNYARNGLTREWKPGDLKYVDSDGNGTVDAGDRVIIGNLNPDFLYGFNFTAMYNGFDLTTFFQGTIGGSAYMESEVVGEFSGFNGKPTTFWRNAWTPENTNTDIPRVSALGKNAPSIANGVNSNYWLINSSYLRLKNLQIGYTIPKNVVQKLHLANVRVYYSGQNLLTFSRFLDGFDPESPSGRGSHYPQLIVNSLGINVTF